MDLTLKIGGEAGQGLQTVGRILSRSFARAGYHVFTHQDYESRIRGGHNFYQIRVSDSPLNCGAPGVDVLVALDTKSLDLHLGELTKRGVAAFDPAELIKSTVKRPGGGQESKLLEVPFKELALKDGGSPLMANTVATGAVLGILGMKISPLLEEIKQLFGKKGDKVVAANLRAAEAGYSHAGEHCTHCGFNLSAPSGSPKRLISGTEAIALGAAASGLGFYAAYPMTPATGIMNILAGLGASEHIVVEQAEDEIAAINMALGASFAGARAMTGTSGGGFALMAEGLSLAGMTETPVVIAEGQRPGPATGLPTRTGQGDLLFALHAGHGEFPRVLFAPGTPEDALVLTNRAFDLSEKYQVPAIILFDQHLGDSERTYDALPLGELVFTEHRLRGKAFAGIKEYRRYELTGSGVSPLGVPGDCTQVVVFDSDEHGTEGHITEDAGIRTAMTEKRVIKKLSALRAEIRPPKLYGSPEPDTLLISWGSTYGAIREAVETFNRGGGRAAFLHFTEISPFPAPVAGKAGGGDFMAIIKSAPRVLCVEQNATGQFERLIRAETGLGDFDAPLRRYDGRPLSTDDVLGALREDA